MEGSPHALNSFSAHGAEFHKPKAMSNVSTNPAIHQYEGDNALWCYIGVHAYDTDRCRYCQRRNTQVEYKPAQE